MAAVLATIGTALLRDKAISANGYPLADYCQVPFPRKRESTGAGNREEWLGRYGERSRETCRPRGEGGRSQSLHGT